MLLGIFKKEVIEKKLLIHSPNWQRGTESAGASSSFLLPTGSSCHVFALNLLPHGVTVSTVKNNTATHPGSRPWKPVYVLFHAVSLGPYLGKDIWEYCVTNIGSGTDWPLSITVAETQLITMVPLSTVSTMWDVLYLSGALPLHWKPCIWHGVASALWECGMTMSTFNHRPSTLPSHGSVPGSALSAPVYAMFYWGVSPFLQEKRHTKRGEGASEPGFGVRIIHGVRMVLWLDVFKSR